MAWMRDGGDGAWLAGFRAPVLLVLLALVAAAPARAQTHLSPAKGANKMPAVPSVSALAARGFAVKAVGRGQGLILQKGGDVYWCTMSLAQTRPMSYRSQCYAVR